MPFHQVSTNRAIGNDSRGRLSIPTYHVRTHPQSCVCETLPPKKCIALPWGQDSVWPQVGEQGCQWFMIMIPMISDAYISQYSLPYEPWWWCLQLALPWFATWMIMVILSSYRSVGICLLIIISENAIRLAGRAHHSPAIFTVDLAKCRLSRTSA